MRAEMRDGEVAADFDRLWSRLAPIGRDDRTGGYHRFAWTAADAELRDWFEATAVAMGLVVEVDRNGNQWAWWGEPGPGAVVTGSHLDSVPGGGAYDGPLGVVSALLAVQAVRAAGTEPGRPVAVVAMVDEEGARFGVACLGSRLLTGAIEPDVARALVDADGVSVATAMTAAGIDAAAIGRDDQALQRIGTFVELHVEQGRSLVDSGRAVGVASAIWPHGRWRLDVRGEGNHAGTTRLADRSDPVIATAATVLAAREIAGRHGGLATFGKLVVDPNGTNVIAAAVTAWLDARGPDEPTVRTMVADIEAAARSSADAERVSVEVTRESWSPEVGFDSDLRDRMARLLDDAPVLPTGAGHDAGVLAAAGVPTAMLFVRNPTGVSHSPAETATRADCLAGVDALRRVLLELVGDR